MKGTLSGYRKVKICQGMVIIRILLNAFIQSHVSLKKKKSCHILADWQCSKEDYVRHKNYFVSYIFIVCSTSVS